MKTKIENFEVCIPNLEGTDVERKLTVQVPLEWDADFGEWVLSEEAHRIIEDTKAREMGLLQPRQLKELRERHGYTQKQMGELFQIGEKSWSRWESGKHRPSRSVNLLFRMLYDHAVSVEHLWKCAGKTPPEIARVPDHWAALLKKGIHEEYSPLHFIAGELAAWMTSHNEKFSPQRQDILASDLNWGSVCIGKDSMKRTAGIRPYLRQSLTQELVS